MKIKFQMTLDEYDSALVEKAIETIERDAYYRGTRRNWLIGWAIRAVMAAIIREGCMPCPLGVELRHEHPDDQAERMGDGKPKGVNEDADESDDDDDDDSADWRLSA